jgi:hypothetical protein
MYDLSKRLDQVLGLIKDDQCAKGIHQSCNHAIFGASKGNAPHPKKALHAVGFNVNFGRKRKGVKQ